MHGISFTAIDFETANSFRASACAVGMTKVRAGKIVDTASWLMEPLPGYGEFHPINVGIHGITARQVRGQGDWRRHYAPMLDFIGDDTLVGHNVAFERSVINKANEAAGIAAGTFDYRCTVALAKRHLSLPSYTLSAVVLALELPAFSHHDAGDDATASAQVALELARRSRAASLDELWPAPAAKVRAAARR